MVIITALKVNQANVGKRIASSKIKKEWKIEIDQREYKVVFTVSKRSRKIRIFINDRKMIDTTSKMRIFKEEIQIDEAILEFETDFRQKLTLKINNMDFDCIFFENDVSVRNRSIDLSDNSGSILSSDSYSKYSKISTFFSTPIFMNSNYIHYQIFN